MEKSKNVYIIQDGTIPPRRIYEELESRGGEPKTTLLFVKYFAEKGAYFIRHDNIISRLNLEIQEILTEGKTRLFYEQEGDYFYEQRDSDKAPAEPSRTDIIYDACQDFLTRYKLQLTEPMKLAFYMGFLNGAEWEKKNNEQ